MLTQQTGETQSGGRDGGRPLPLTPGRSAALSGLLDQALAKEERCEEIAAYYSQLAAKHRAVRRALAMLIP